MRSAPRYRLVLIALGTVFLTGCAIRARQPLTPPTTTPETLEVFYVTDREPITTTKNCPPGERNPGVLDYANERAEDGRSSYGKVRLSILTNSPVGKPLETAPFLGCDSRGSITRFGSGTDGSKSEFYASLSDSLFHTGRKEIFVFVHGYNAKFAEAILWTAQLKNDLNFGGAAILFSWPSRGGRLQYAVDETNVEWSTPHLRELLEELAVNSQGTPVHLIAHSMGSRALLQVLNGLATEHSSPPARRFAQVILAAPDIDSDSFRQLVPPILKIATRVTLYTSSKDQALIASGRIHFYPRAGDSAHDLVTIPGMDTVDVTLVDRSRFHHSYFLENRWALADMFQLLSIGIDPQQRFGVFRVGSGSGTYWQLRP